ncbi:MAG: ATP phosphoribosyltransferase [Roseovarius sp.]|nr:ATP phosphoribosyltransferase [Roseovarius sp.]
MSVKIGVPSKGRLMEDAFKWFGLKGLTAVHGGLEREYSGTLDGILNVELVMLSAGEIPRELSVGRIHFGITGMDLVREKLGLWDRRVVETVKLEFGHADLVIAVPSFWVDVNTLDDLDAAAAAFRRRHGFRLRIATKYHRLVREFLRNHGVADYQLVDSQGATEGAVKNETAEAIADITTTGVTLRANHLKILEDGVVLKSQAMMYRALCAETSDEDKATLNELLMRFKQN